MVAYRVNCLGGQIAPIEMETLKNLTGNNKHL